MESRKRYTQEFKREAVSQTEAPGVTIQKVAQELGINPRLLSRWRSDLRASGEKAFPGHGNPRDEEMTALKRDLARVTKERDFLREAAAFFAKTSK